MRNIPGEIELFLDLLEREELHVVLLMANGEIAEELNRNELADLYLDGGL